MFLVALARRGLGNGLRQTMAVLLHIITHSLPYLTTVSQLVKKATTLYGTQQFITVFQSSITERDRASTWRSKMFHCYACTAIEMCCCYYSTGDTRIVTDGPLTRGPEVCAGLRHLRWWMAFSATTTTRCFKAIWSLWRDSYWDNTIHHPL